MNNKQRARLARAQAEYDLDPFGPRDYRGFYDRYFAWIVLIAAATFFVVVWIAGQTNL